MTRNEFKALTARQIVILDGATGTELSKRGLPPGVCPEAWCLEHPEAILAVQRDYIAAGANIIYTPTFGGNPLKLQEFGLAEQTREINRGLATISRQAGDAVLVFGDLAPTGQFLEPVGDLPFEAAVDAYREQARGLLEGGVDGFVIETMMDVQETRAALLAIREICDLPVLVSLTFEKGQHTLTGNHAVSALITLQALGADAFGCNCSSGPEEMLETIRLLKPYSRVPLIAKPNAGLPQFIDGRTVFNLQAEEFSRQTALLAEAGAGLLGGCCGTTPEHIRALSQILAGRPAPAVEPWRGACVSSARNWHEITPGGPFTLVGERLNPTGKKALQAELRAGKLELVRQIADEQIEAGAALLDLNMGLSGIDERAMMQQAVALLSSETALPLCIDTTSAEVAEAALRAYPGRALFNSITAETQRLQEVLPIAAKYGAMLILLPVTDQGIPETLPERIAVIEQIYAEAQKYGYRKEDLCVDALVMTVSANPAAAALTLGLIEWCSREWGSNTIIGLSNISFGLPRRELLNRTFLGMALGCGLNCAIANPMLTDIQETILAGDLLNRRDQRCQKYLARFGGQETATAAAPAAKIPADPRQRVRAALLNGDSSLMPESLRAALAAGHSADELVNAVLIPAIAEVGERFERKEYFLPQLIMSADVMRLAMEILDPILRQTGQNQPSRGKIIIATVKNDIHDIGKNIVALLLRNYNFTVIDLGKDVAAETILEAAQREDARLVALSALMTTTMGEMKTVIDLARQRGLNHLQFIVGGAVIDEPYARSIGAHYAANAHDTVKIASRLLA